MQTAKIFMNGGSQAVRLPKQFRFEGSEVEIQQVGDTILLKPITNKWDEMFAKIDQLDISDDFMSDREQPGPQQRPALDELLK